MKTGLSKFRMILGWTLVALVLAPLVVFLGAGKKPPLKVTVIELEADSAGDWMATVTLENRSRRVFLVPGNSEDFVLHEVVTPEETLRHPPETDEEVQVNHLFLNGNARLTTRVHIPARMGSQPVHVRFFCQAEGIAYAPSDWLRDLKIWFDRYQWGKDPDKRILIRTPQFVPSQLDQEL